MICYRSFIDTDPLSSTGFEILSLIVCRSRPWPYRVSDVVGHVTIPFAIRDFLQVFHWNWHCICNTFQDIKYKCIGDTTLTFQGHVTSSIMRPFDSQYVISYWCSIGTVILSLIDFEILRHKCIGVTTLTYQGHVISSVTWPFDSHYWIFYRCSSDTHPLSWIVFETLSFKRIQIVILTFQGHVTLSVTWPFDSHYVVSYR